MEKLIKDLSFLHKLRNNLMTYATVLFNGLIFYREHTQAQTLIVQIPCQTLGAHKAHKAIASELAVRGISKYFFSR